MSAHPRLTRVRGLVALAVILLLCAAGGEAVAVPLTVQPPGTTSQAPITLVGLGDSVTAASNCDCTGFVTDYADILGRSTDRPVTVFNLGVDGQTSSGLLAALQPDQPDVDPLSAATVVTITIGANDFGPEVPAMQAGQCADLACTATRLATMSRNVGSIIDRIRALRSGAAVQIKVTGYWNVFEDGEVARNHYTPAFRTASDVLTRHLNSALQQVCATKRVQYVDIYTPFKGDGDADDTDLLASDGDHPNAAGHRVIAQALARSS